MKSFVESISTNTLRNSGLTVGSRIGIKNASVAWDGLYCMEVPHSAWSLNYRWLVIQPVTGGAEISYAFKYFSLSFSKIYLKNL